MGSMKPTTSSRNIEVVKSPPTCLYILVMVMWIYDHLRREILRSEVLRWPGSQMLEREHELTRLTPENSAKTRLRPETRPSEKWYTLSRYMYLTILNNCLCISGIERGWGGTSHKIKMCLTELMRKLFVGFIGLLRTLKGPLRHPAH